MIKRLLKNKKVWIGITVLFAILLIWTLWGNKALELNIYKISSNRLPESFDGYRIVHFGSGCGYYVCVDAEI